MSHGPVSDRVAGARSEMPLAVTLHCVTAQLFGLNRHRRGELRGLGLVFGLFAWGFFWLGPRRPPRKAHASSCVYISLRGGSLVAVVQCQQWMGPSLPMMASLTLLFLFDGGETWGYQSISPTTTAARQKYLRTQIPRGPGDARASRRRGAVATSLREWRRRRGRGRHHRLIVWPLFIIFPEGPKSCHPFAYPGSK